MTYQEILADLRYCLDNNLTTVIQQQDVVYGTECGFKRIYWCGDCPHYEQEHRWCNNNAGCTNRLLKDVKQSNPEFFI